MPELGRQLLLMAAFMRPVRSVCSARSVSVGYGQESDGVVVALGIGLVGSGVGEVAQVANLSGRFDLFFDWIRGIVIEPGDHAGCRAWIDAIIYRDPDPDMW